MKSIQSVAIIATLALTVFSGCKTSEKNYRTAYETARQHQIERNGGEDLTNGVALTQTGMFKPAAHTIGDVTFPMATTWVRSESGVTSPLDSLHRYNVAVGQFKQIFNARALFNRLKNSHYPDAVMMKTSEGYYVVASMSTNVPVEALKGLEEVKADTTIKPREPFPFILRPAQFAR